MPFIRVDPEAYDEFVEEFDGEDLPDGLGARPSGEFEYEVAAARFDPAGLNWLARPTLDALRALGATGFRIRYDGGHDEGFAHADAVIFGATARPVAEIEAELVNAGFADRIRLSPDMPPHFAGYLAAKPSPASVVGDGIFELAHDLASKLLGDGYGTGEYELYGAFTADFRTGELVDDPDAAKPKGMD